MLDCGKVCGRLLGCNKHYCTSGCHSPHCAPCPEQGMGSILLFVFFFFSRLSCHSLHTFSFLTSEEQRCYCGLGSRTAPCGAGEVDHSRADATASYSCGGICSRYLIISLSILYISLSFYVYHFSSSTYIHWFRKLKCGQHSCTMQCHMGPCPPCPRAVDQVIFVCFLSYVFFHFLPPHLSFFNMQLILTALERYLSLWISIGIHTGK